MLYTTPFYLNFTVSRPPKLIVLFVGEYEWKKLKKKKSENVLMTTEILCSYKRAIMRIPILNSFNLAFHGFKFQITKQPV